MKNYTGPGKIDDKAWWLRKTTYIENNIYHEKVKKATRSNAVEVRDAEEDPFVFSSIQKSFQARSILFIWYLIHAS